MVFSNQGGSESGVDNTGDWEFDSNRYLAVVAFFTRFLSSFRSLFITQHLSPPTPRKKPFVNILPPLQFLKTFELTTGHGLFSESLRLSEVERA